MSTIYFVSDLESSTLKTLKDARDSADIVKDLGRINYTITRGSEQDARTLDHELRQKYPAIDAMLRTADDLQAARYFRVFQPLKVSLLQNQICVKTTGELFVMQQSKGGLKRA